MPRPGRKENVLEAALGLFSQKGYHGTTVRDIAQESGMLSGSLYAHVASKEEILFELVMRAADQFTEALNPIADGPGTASEKLRLAMVAHIRVVAGSLEAATVFLHEWKALSPERGALILERRRQVDQLFARIIAEGISSGEFRDLNPRFARLLVLSACNWLYAWYDPEGPLQPEEIAEQFSHLLLRGFLREGGIT
jgi:AcrR family transcriptional regulator